MFPDGFLGHRHVLYALVVVLCRLVVVIVHVIVLVHGPTSPVRGSPLPARRVSRRHSPAPFVRHLWLLVLRIERLLLLVLLLLLLWGQRWRRWRGGRRRGRGGRRQRRRFGRFVQRFVPAHSDGWARIGDTQRPTGRTYRELHVSHVGRSIWTGLGYRKRGKRRREKRETKRSEEEAPNRLNRKVFISFTWMFLANSVMTPVPGGTTIFGGPA